MPAALGPASIARYTSGNSGSVWAAVPATPAGPPMTRSTPPHEMAKASTKYITTGWVVLMKAFMS